MAEQKGILKTLSLQGTTNPSIQSNVVFEGQLWYLSYGISQEICSQSQCSIRGHKRNKQLVAANICKIYVGGRNYLPAAQVFCDTIKFWTRIVKQRKGVLTSRNALQVLAKRLKFLLDMPKRLTLEQANVKMTKA